LYDEADKLLGFSVSVKTGLQTLLTPHQLCSPMHTAFVVSTIKEMHYTIINIRFIQRCLGRIFLRSVATTSATTQQTSTKGKRSSTV